MRTGSAAVAVALREHRTRSEDWEGMCLRFVRTCLGVPYRWDDARSAWQHVADTDRHAGPKPPPAVPVWWDVGAHGHVALSAGGGRVWSTDILRAGHVDLVTIGFVTREWRARYMGWSETINGARVYDRARAVPPRTSVSLARVVAAFRADPARAQGSGIHEADVRPVELALMAEGLLDDRWARDGAAGSKTRAAYSRWQHRLGFVGADANGIPGPKSLRRLAAEHGFEVTP